MKSFLALSNLLIGPVVTNHLFREKMCLLSPHTKFFVRNEKNGFRRISVNKRKEKFSTKLFCSFLAIYDMHS